MKCPQHYLTDMQEVILFYNGLDVPTRQILDSKGVILTKTATEAKVAFQEMAEYSQKWHNRTSSKTKDGPHSSYSKITSQQQLERRTKASNLQRIPPGVQGRSHFTYFWSIDLRNQIGNEHSGMNHQTLDSKGVILTKTATEAKVAIQEMVEYSQKWHNRTSSKTKRSDANYAKDHTTQRNVNSRKKGKLLKMLTTHNLENPINLEDSIEQQGQDSGEMLESGHETREKGLKV
ncbi:hypothetical protein Tco_0374082 [Tanacetum coccineum]